MIDKEKILDTVTERLKNLPVGHYLDLRTYKRNRSVIIVKIDAPVFPSVGQDRQLHLVFQGYVRVSLRCASQVC